MYEVIDGKCTRQIKLFNSIYANLSLTKCLLIKKDLRKKIEYGGLFVYVQCDIEVPESLREDFIIFSPIFRNNFVGRDDKEYDEIEGLLTQPSRMLITSPWRMEQSLHRCCCFIQTWGCFAKKSIALFNTHQ